MRYPKITRWQQPSTWSNYEIQSSNDRDQYGLFTPSADATRHRYNRIDAVLVFRKKFATDTSADPYMELDAQFNGYQNRPIDLNRKRSELFPQGFVLRLGGLSFAAAQLAVQRYAKGAVPTTGEMSLISAALKNGEPGLGIWHKSEGEDEYALNGKLTTKTAEGDTAAPVHFGANQIPANNPITNAATFPPSRPAPSPFPLARSGLWSAADLY